MYMKVIISYHENKINIINLLKPEIPLLNYAILTWYNIMTKDSNRFRKKKYSKNNLKFFHGIVLQIRNKNFKENLLFGRLPL